MLYLSVNEFAMQIIILFFSFLINVLALDVLQLIFSKLDEIIVIFQHKCFMPVKMIFLSI